MRGEVPSPEHPKQGEVSAGDKGELELFGLGGGSASREHLLWELRETWPPTAPARQESRLPSGQSCARSVAPIASRSPPPSLHLPPPLPALEPADFFHNQETIKQPLELLLLLPAPPSPRAKDAVSIPKARCCSVLLFHPPRRENHPPGCKYLGFVK